MRLIEKPNDLTGNRTPDVPACIIVPEPTTLPLGCLYFLGVLRKTTWNLSIFGVATDIHVGYLTNISPVSRRFIYFGHSVEKRSETIALYV
jgi:hypothetical protein